MKKDLISALAAVVACTLLFGLAYPLVVTGISQVAFGKKADGDPNLVAHDVKGSPRYFQPRPSATGYSTSATFFANRGPNQASAAAFYREQIAAYRRLNGDVTPPADAVTMSGSGVDPLISADNARIQARRVARVRGLPLARIQALIRANTDGRSLGLFGEPGVNTTKLNRALDAEASR
jgi:K+-transporting ATPase ATPase C chain